MVRTSFHALHLELFTVSPGVPPPEHSPFHVLRSGEHQLALLISFRIHRFSRGCALEPCQNKPRLKHAWSLDVCPSAARPCLYVWQPVRQSTPKACPLFVLQNRTNMQRRSSEPAAAQIQGMKFNAPSPVCAAENPPHLIA